MGLKNKKINGVDLFISGKKVGCINPNSLNFPDIKMVKESAKFHKFEYTFPKSDDVWIVINAYSNIDTRETTIIAEKKC